MSHSSSPARIQISADVEVGFGGSSLSTVSTTTFSDSSDSSLSEPSLAPSAQRALDDDLGEEQGDPFLISDDDLLAVLERARSGRHKIPLRSSSRKYKDAFSGHRLIAYLMEYEQEHVNSATEALAIAQLLLDGSWIVSVRDPPIREFENSKKAMYTFGPTDPTSTTSASRLVQRALDNTQKLQELVMRFSFDVERIDPKSRTFSGSEAADWFLNELNLNPAWASDVRWSHNDVVALLQLLQDLHCIRRSASISRTFRASSDAKYTLVDVTQLYITLIKRRTGARRIGEAAAIEGFSPKHPILIIPGLASSALEVWESSIQPEWKGERVWLDIGKIGHAAKVKQLSEILSRVVGSRSSTSSSPSTSILPSSGGGGGSSSSSSSSSSMSSSDDSIGSTPTAASHSNDRNSMLRMFLHHLCPAEDGFSDPPGIRIRPVEGLGAIDYLSHSSLTKAPSYVFGHMIRNLIDVGYDRKSLQAAPYDWRLPLPKLEERDGYFTHLKAQIEVMRKTNNAPVVLVCHSMGNRVVQYFFSWVESSIDDPDERERWFDTNIHAYVPLGAPFLGATKVVRGLLSGDALGLEMFLMLKESLYFGRSLGSIPCLFPMRHPDHPQPITFLRDLRKVPSSPAEPAFSTECKRWMHITSRWSEYIDYARPMDSTTRSFLALFRELEAQTHSTARESTLITKPLSSQQALAPPPPTDTPTNWLRLLPSKIYGVWKLDGEFSDSLRVFGNSINSRAAQPVAQLPETQASVTLRKLTPLVDGLKIKTKIDGRLTFSDTIYFHSVSEIGTPLFGTVEKSSFFCDSGVTMVSLGHHSTGITAQLYRVSFDERSPLKTNSTSAANEFTNLTMSEIILYRNDTTGQTEKLIRIFRKVAASEFDDSPAEQLVPAGPASPMQVSFQQHHRLNDVDPIDFAWYHAQTVDASTLPSIARWFEYYRQLNTEPYPEQPSTRLVITPSSFGGDWMVDARNSKSMVPILEVAHASKLKRRAGEATFDDSNTMNRITPTKRGLVLKKLVAGVPTYLHDAVFNRPHTVPVTLYGNADAVAFFVDNGREYVVVFIHDTYVLVMVTHLLSETKHRIRYYIQRLDDTSLKASVDQFYKREKGIELAPVSPTPSSKQTYAPISPGKLLGAIAPHSWKLYEQYYVHNELFLDGYSGSGDAAFEAESLNRTTGSSITLPPILDLPPVKNILCIYGVNRATEVSYYFKARKTKTSLDKSADRLSNKISPDNPAGLLVEGGIGYETRSTPQPVINGKNRSGDGTVPYCSLAYAKVWQRMALEREHEGKIQVLEMEGLEHRAMLRDEALIFHVMMIGCTGGFHAMTRLEKDD